MFQAYDKHSHDVSKKCLKESRTTANKAALADGSLKLSNNG